MVVVEHGHFARRNVCDDKHLVRNRRQRRLDAAQQMVRHVRELRDGRRSRLDRRARTFIRQMGA